MTSKQFDARWLLWSICSTGVEIVSLHREAPLVLAAADPLVVCKAFGLC